MGRDGLSRRRSAALRTISIPPSALTADCISRTSPAPWLTPPCWGRRASSAQAEAGQLIDGLQGILNDLESGALEFDSGCEDIHMFVEQVLTQRLGDVGKKLHTARSRNDQVALDLRMYLQRPDRCDYRAGKGRACGDRRPGGSQQERHHARLHPFAAGAAHHCSAHHLMAYAMMLLRDLGRLGDCRKRMNVCPIGSCALAGTTYPTDRRFEARKLGFDDIARNSIDGVSDRDFCVELMSAVFHTHDAPEPVFRGDHPLVQAGNSSSSSCPTPTPPARPSCPRRRTPTWRSCVRGKTGRVYGDLMGLLTTLKGLPLAYNKDMQEDKEARFRRRGHGEDVPDRSLPPCLPP